jgi:hypothetical protein
MRRPLGPTFRARAICIFQIVALTVALLPGLGAPASALLPAIALPALAGSFLIDARRQWTHRLEP